jgi:hypothetical protein
LKRSEGPDEVPTEDRRLKQLKFLIEDVGEKEKSLKAPKLVLQVLKRIHLAELAAKYTEETEAEAAAPKQPRRPSVKQRYVDLFFPHTINCRSKNARKGKNTRKGKKGRQVSGQKGQQTSEEEVRKKAENAFQYWIRLGKPLWRMSQCYGLPILVVLPKEVTEKR